MRAPTYSTENLHVSSSNTTATSALVAFRILLKYGSKTPTFRDLMADFGMCRATAYRWLSALKIAKGQA